MKSDRSLAECLERVAQISHYQGTDYEPIRLRIGDELLRKRLNRQLDLYETHRTHPHAETLHWRHRVMRFLVHWGLTCTGLLARARQHARQPEVVERTVHLPNLPESFDGYRILHLTDFHFEFIPELPGILNQALHGVECDLCVLTGDFRGETTGPYEESLSHLAQCRDQLGSEVIAVLGNHDNIEILTRLPELGIRCLLNEAMVLERKGESILLVGVDDAQHYQTHDLSFCCEQVSDAPVSILLSHTPEICREAVAAGFQFMLSGHTHGGQICLPGGIPVLGHIGSAPRKCIRGSWKMDQLQGYTSRGIGCSSIDVRLNCPPEITVHTLRQA